MQRCWILLLLVSPQARADVTISHAPVGCVVAGKLPRVESALAPADAVVQARVFFRAAGAASWYYVPMARDGAAFRGVLPKPLKSTPSIEYYIETVDAAVNTSRTQEYSAQVVADAGACSKKLLVAAVAAAAKVAVGVPAGVSGLSLVPAGFAADGIVAATAAAGAAGSAGGAAGAGAGSAAAGGGIGAGALVVAGVAVVGGAAAVAVSKSGGDGDSSGGGSTGPGGSTLVSYNINFPQPFLDVTACAAGKTVMFCCQGVSADQNGNFSSVWNPASDPVLRVVGNLNATTFTAALSCTNGGGPTGSMNATGSGGSYSGTFNFAGKSGPFTVTKQ